MSGPGHRETLFSVCLFLGDLISISENVVSLHLSLSKCIAVNIVIITVYFCTIYGWTDGWMVDGLIERQTKGWIDRSWMNSTSIPHNTHAQQHHLFPCIHWSLCVFPLGYHSHPFTPSKLCGAVDEAKVHAAEHALQTLGLTAEGAADLAAATAAVTSVAFPGM